MKKIKLLATVAALLIGLASCNFDPSTGGGPGGLPSILQANFVHTVYLQNNQAEVSLINTSIGATSYEWSFPGGTPTSSFETTPAPVVYTQDGTYEITLIASDGNDTDEITKTVIIEGLGDGSGSGVLSAAFGVNLTVQNGIAVVTVDNQSTGATSYDWSFPGGTPDSSQEENPSAITYTQDGTYTITLEVSDGTDVDTATSTISISGISS